jgi:hypothetical protein
MKYVLVLIFYQLEVKIYSFAKTFNLELVEDASHGSMLTHTNACTP